MLSKSNLHDAMNNVKPSIKFRVSDNMSTLMQTLVEGMRGRESVSAEAQPGGARMKRPSEGGEGDGGGREERRRKSESRAGRAAGGSEGSDGGADSEGEGAAVTVGATGESARSPAPDSRGAVSLGMARRSEEQGEMRDVSGRSAHLTPEVCQLAASAPETVPASSPVRHAGIPIQPHAPPAQTEWACLKSMDGKTFPISTSTDVPFNIGREPGGHEHSLPISAQDAIKFVSRLHCSILKTRAGTSTTLAPILRHTCHNLTGYYL